MLEKLTKGVVLLAILCYTAGVLTVSVYLHGLDAPVPDVQALKARFIVTGLSTITAVGVAIAYELTVWWAINLRSVDKNKMSCLRMWTIGIVGFGCGLVLWAFLLAYDAPAHPWTRWQPAVLAWVATLVAAVPTTAGVGRYYIEGKKHDEGVFLALGGVGVVCAMAFVLV
ncbi:MAG TPA: hypothetical protein VI300_03035, partial [Solirubrobacter sp.]